MRAILEEHARSLLDMYCAGTVIASSGRKNRHRLNKGGNWQGNMALHRIASLSSACDTTNPPRTTSSRKPARAKASSRLSAASNSSSPARHQPNVAPDYTNCASDTITPNNRSARCYAYR